MLIELGTALRDARGNRNASLDAIASPAKISATYLQKLERGEVGSPSPRVLARLAAVLDVSYLRLMELAGYLDEEQFAQTQLRAASPKPHPLEGQHLSSEEWKQVGQFIRELIAKR